MNLEEFRWMQKIHYTYRNILTGILVYGIGDTIAMIISGNLSVPRNVGMMVLGATIYAVEVPNWFRYIDRITAGKTNDTGAKAFRMIMAIAYFNPIWIARHIFFISLFTGTVQTLSSGIFATASMSFVTNLPFTLLGNYVIQNKISFKWRYAASSVFSSIMAILYAMGAIWFK